MSLDSPEEQERAQSFQILGYDSGFFDPTGKKIDIPFSERGLEDWERTNQNSENKMFGIGQKLLLPENPSPGLRILFGRDGEKVDVVIDWDLVDNFARGEMGVSRQHFELDSTTDGKWEIQDMGSTNGTHIFSSNKSIELKEVEEPHVLQDGDSIIVGGGPGIQARLIGIRYFEKEGESPYLVKFNAKSADDIASAIGLYERRPELIGGMPGEAENVTEKAVGKAGNELVRMQISLMYLRDKDEKIFNKQSMAFERRRLDLLEELGETHYQGAWGLAAMELGDWAYQKGTRMMEDVRAGKDVDLELTKGYLTLASSTMQLAQDNTSTAY
jgi:pSer/pThr/pTyr-binding forkhead associated (FHA) protein